MDPYKLLKADHEAVSRLFERIESSSGREKMKIFRQLKEELDVHAHVEETIFYPALKNEEESREITLEAFEEHRVVKDLLTELDAATKPSDQWDAKLTVLKENVEHHVDEEEGELFDRAKEVLTTEEAERLGDQMAAEKARQGVPVSGQVKKPGLFKTVVNAIFGETGKSAKPKRTATKTATPKSAARRSSKKKTATKKARKTTTAAARKSGRKSTNKPVRKAA